MKVITKATDSSPWDAWLGYNVVIRTVTMYYVGRLVAIGDQELVLEDCAWLVDSGRWSDFLAGRAAPKEVEPFPAGRVIIGRSAVIDATLWSYDLLRNPV